MRFSRTIALAAVVGVLATGPACAKRDADKLALQKILDLSAHTSGRVLYQNDTPEAKLFGVNQPATTVVVRGLVEDDFRFKAIVNVNGAEAIDEVVNDDAFALRFVDPSLMNQYSSITSIEPATAQALQARYWVVDPAGAPAVGGAAVTDQVLGIDPVVDSLSVVAYTKLAIDQSAAVAKFNAEALNYRPKEDPFPRPAKGSGVIRWDLSPPKLPKADAQDQSGQGASVRLAKPAVFRKMAIYIKDGRLFQVREKVDAEYDLANSFTDYVRRLAKESKDANIEAQVKQALDTIKDARTRTFFDLFALNQGLISSGEQPVQFRTMTYQFSDQGAKDLHADLPTDNVARGSLSFFGVAAAKAKAAIQQARRGNVTGSGSSAGATSSTLPGFAPTTSTSTP